MLRLMRFCLLVSGSVLILDAAVLSLSRTGSDGAYWLLSTETSGRGLYDQVVGERERHPMRGFDTRMRFDQWSPDKKWLYFRTTDQSYNATHAVSTLYRMRVGSIRRECLGAMIYPYGTYPTLDFAISPDFEQVAYASPLDEPNGLYITRGGCQNSVPVFRPENEIIDSLFWSPDGDWLYFHAHHETLPQSHLYRIRPDGSNAAILTRTFVSPAETFNRWEWSPDSTWLMLTSCTYLNSGPCSLYTFRSDGSIYIHLGDSVSYRYDAVWSSDNRWIIYQATGGEEIGDDIFRVRPDGSSRENLTQRNGDVFLYGLTADSEWILYGIRETDSEALYRMRLDGTEEQVLFEDALLPSEVIAPLITYDNWIYIYDRMVESDDARTRTLYRLRPDGSDAQPLVTGNFNRNLWYLSPDGQSLMSTYPDPNIINTGATLLRMKVDGSEQEHIPIGSDYEPRFSPLFNLPWHTWMGFLAGAAMLAVGVAFGISMNRANP